MIHQQSNRLIASFAMFMMNMNLRLMILWSCSFPATEMYLDLDYYVEMGSAAYTNLSRWTRDDSLSQTYQVFSERFVEFVDVLSYVSEKSTIQGDQDILRLYERYIRTGSEMARDRLTELGVVTDPAIKGKVFKVTG